MTFLDLDLDAGDLGGTLEWAEPSDATQVTRYDVYITEASHAGCGRIEVVVISGSLSFGLDGASPAQVEAAVKSSLAMSLGVDPRLVEVVVRQEQARRLSHERRLSTTWNVRYQVVLPAEQGPSAERAAKAVRQDASAFTKVLAEQLEVAGVDSAVLSASFAFQSFEFVAAKSVAGEEVISLATIVDLEELESESNTTEELESNNTNNTNNNNSNNDNNNNSNNNNTTVDSDGESDGVNRTSLRRLSETPEGSSLKLCRLVFLGAVSVGRFKFDVPADTALASFTYFTIYTRTKLESQGVAYSTLFIDDLAASVSNVAFVDQDSSSADIGGAVSWTQPSDLQRVATYHVYLAASEVGASRLLVADVRADTTST
ncbi:unnamed protein product, partial [Polarella glacialis]